MEARDDADQVTKVQGEVDMSISENVNGGDETETEVRCNTKCAQILLAPFGNIATRQARQARTQTTQA